MTAGGPAPSAPLPSVPSLARYLPRILAALREHQPLFVLLSLSLVVATFARSELAVVLAVLAFGFLLVAIMILIYLAVPTERNPSDVLLEGLVVIYFSSGLLFLALAAWALVTAVGPYELVLFAPYLLLGVALMAGVLYREHKRMRAAPRRPVAVRVYGFLCLCSVALAPFAAIFVAVGLAFPRSPIIDLLGTPAALVVSVLGPALLVSHAEAKKALSTSAD